MEIIKDITIRNGMHAESGFNLRGFMEWNQRKPSWWTICRPHLDVI